MEIEKVMEEFVLKADPRNEFGSRAARRLRASGGLPANIYGHGEQNLSVILDAKEFGHFFDAGHRIVTINVSGKKETSVIKEVQYDAIGAALLHVDFNRVSKDEAITIEVPVETVGTAKGVAGGGILETPLKGVRLEGLADKIPERLEVTIDEMQVGDTIRVRDLTLPEGCRVLDQEDLVVVAVTTTSVESEVDVGEAATSEPEFIGRKKDEEPEGQ